MWSQLTLVTDAELGQLEPEATAAGAPWGATTWSSQRTEAKRDLKIWLERDYASIPNVADRILDRWSPDYAFRLVGGAYTDVTSEVRDDEEEDLNLAGVFVTVANDRLYIGAAYEFEGLFVKLLDSVNAAASVLTVKYWGDNQWESLSATDGTAVSGATFAKSGRITWTLPSDWERRTLNGTADEYYWVELSVSAALTAGTSATQVLPIRASDALKRIAGYLALAHIFRGLAAQAATPEAWLVRASNPDRTGYQDRAEDLYAALRDKGGIPIDLNRTQGIDKAEEHVRAPITLLRG